MQRQALRFEHRGQFNSRRQGQCPRFSGRAGWFAPAQTESLSRTRALDQPPFQGGCVIEHLPPQLSRLPIFPEPENHRRWLPGHWFQAQLTLRKKPGFLRTFITPVLTASSNDFRVECDQRVEHGKRQGSYEG